MQGRGHVDDGLQAESISNPLTASTTNRLLSSRKRQETAQDDEGKERDDHEAPDEAEFLARHGKHEIGMRVGNRHFDGAFAGACAEQSAIGEGIERAVDLVGIAAMAQEFIHARCKMRKGVISDEQPGDAGDKANAHDGEGQSGEKKFAEPYRRRQKRHADIGLHQQRYNNGGE